MVEVNQVSFCFSRKNMLYYFCLKVTIYNISIPIKRYFNSIIYLSDKVLSVNAYIIYQSNK